LSADGNHLGVGVVVEQQLSANVQQLMALDLGLSLRDARDAFERIYFEYHLQQENANITRIAEKTGLERTHLYRKLKQLGISISKSSKKAS
jgi:DNA-binding NtrC family response regulator